MTIDGASIPRDSEYDVPDTGADALESGGMDKGPHAFRTISEVADELHVPQHTLRLWETQFHQVRPLKRGGGRRYYRPDDVVLLGRIADLLYNQGYTVKGVQRLLREGALACPPPIESGDELAEQNVADLAVDTMDDAPVGEDAALSDDPQFAAVVAELPAAVEAGLEQALVAVMAQNIRLRADLSDVLVELEAMRRKILA